ncbi:hypothetical protein COXBURSA334_A0022 [Coxiella burnetii Q321]|nr:hypothetical protein COXBURSA334_A0022 [Coxiella burnetii Q321]
MKPLIIAKQLQKTRELALYLYPSRTTFLTRVYFMLEPT